MDGIEFGADEKAELVTRIRGWMEAELGVELGGFDAEFLLDFFAREIGPQFYNRGVLDSIAALDERMESVKDALWALEKPAGERS